MLGPARAFGDLTNTRACARPSNPPQKTTGGFLSEIGGVCRVNGNLNLSRAIGDLKYKTNRTLEPKDQIITAQPDVRKVALQAEVSALLLRAVWLVCVVGHSVRRALCVPCSVLCVAAAAAAAAARSKQL